MTYDGANLVTYIGRTNVASSAAGTQGVGAQTFAITGTGSVLIGNRGSRDRSLDGWMDDVRFFSGAGSAGLWKTPRLLVVTAGPAAAAAPGNASVALSWPAFSPSGQTGSVTYNVKRGTVSGGPYTLLAAGTGLSGTTFTDSTAVNGTTYCYVVAAVNSAGEGNLVPKSPPRLRPSPPRWKARPTAAA